VAVVVQSPDAPQNQSLPTLAPGEARGMSPLRICAFRPLMRGESAAGRSATPDSLAVGVGRTGGRPGTEP